MQNGPPDSNGTGTGYIEAYGAQDPEDPLQTLVWAHLFRVRPLFCTTAFPRWPRVLTLSTRPSAEVAGRVGREGPGRKLLRLRLGGLSGLEVWIE